MVEEVRPLPHGSGLLTPSLPLVWQLNAVRVEDPAAGPAELMETAEHVLGALGHRKLLVHDAELGARLARPLAAVGWNVLRLLVMVRDRPRAAQRGRRRGRRARSRRPAPAAWPASGASSPSAGRRRR